MKENREAKTKKVRRSDKCDTKCDECDTKCDTKERLRNDQAVQREWIQSADCCSIRS